MIDLPPWDEACAAARGIKRVAARQSYPHIHNLEQGKKKAKLKDYDDVDSGALKLSPVSYQALER